MGLTLIRIEGKSYIPKITKWILNASNYFEIYKQKQQKRCVIIL